MRPSLPIRSTVVCLCAASLLLIAACSKKSNPTSPGGGGGGATDPFDSGLFSSTSPVKVFVHTFATAGDFGYHCSLHGTASSGMRGTVHVVSTAAESVFVTIGDNFFSPSPANVKPGGYVKWTATGGSHSVTTP